MLRTQAEPYLAALVDGTGESANLAMLDGDRIVYIARVQSRQSMRVFTEVGGRAFAHCKNVGKAIMAQSDLTDVRRLLRRTGMPAQRITPSRMPMSSPRHSVLSASKAMR